MPDWSASMQQTYEYYIVDPITWKDVKLIDTVTSCTFDRDSSSSTRGSATIDIAESIGECYIRCYLVTVQNGIRERHPLGTVLVQTPSSNFDGKIKVVSMDAYTPLLELNENQPPLGYYIAKGDNVMEHAYERTREHARAPVAKVACDISLHKDFVANTSDTWLTYLADLLSNAKYEYDIDEMGRILFKPIQDTASLQPVWTYDDGNSSILYPELSTEHDLYGIPNVVEVIYSSGSEYHYARSKPLNPDSPISKESRGREIVYRVTNPELVGDPTDENLQEYADQLLRSMASLEYTVTYTHGYCPVRVGDCVRLDYSRAGLDGVKAKVISQTIKCEPGCPVTEKAVYTKNLWG